MPVKEQGVGGLSRTPTKTLATQKYTAATMEQVWYAGAVHA